VPVATELYQPALHAVHTVDVLAVASMLYWPAVHAVQAVEVAAEATLP
jgi:hypothetical protein